MQSTLSACIALYCFYIPMLFKEFGHGTKKSQWSIGYEKQQQQRINQAQQNNGARANNPVQIIFPEPEENAPLLPHSSI